MHLSSPQLPDLFVSAAIVLSQLGIAMCLWRDGRPKMPPALFLAPVALLALMWPLIGYGIAINVSREMYSASRFPVWFRTLAVAFALVWGSASTASFGIYLIYRFVYRRLERRHSNAPAHASSGKPASSEESASASPLPHFEPDISPAGFSQAGVSQERRTLIHGIGVAAVISPFVAAAFGGIIERTAFEIREVDLHIPNLHPDLAGYRIAQISDLHVSPYLSIRELSRAVGMTNELKPHLTVVTGDLISMPGDPLDETIFELSHLRADHGILGCLGNHEVYAQVEDYTRAEAARFGIEFLRFANREVRRGNGVFNVAGVDFQHFDWRSHYLHGAEKLVRPDMPNILLSHNPDVFRTAARKGFDVTLAGHTHGGQVTVEILSRTANLARFFTPYVIGLYREGNKSCYVNAGIGTIGMPVRIGVPPEITLLRLQPV